MRYSEIKQIVKAHLDAGDFRTVFSIEGSPGCGKSALGDELAADCGFDNVVNLNLSLVDIPDVAGIALPGDNKKADAPLTFRHTEDMRKLRTGRNLLILDELADASIQMQNAGRRLMWTREINGLRISDETFIITMSNRSKDKSGAGRMSGKVRNAVTRLTLDSNLDDFLHWAETKGGISLDITSYLRFRPDHLDQFDPDAESSPTPRQWDLVNRVPTTLPRNLYIASVAGKIGEGYAAEFAGFLRVRDNLVKPEDIVKAPETTPIPQKLDALYATVAALAQYIDKDNATPIGEYVARLPDEFGVMFWTMAPRRNMALMQTKAYGKWACNDGNDKMN